VEAGRYDGAAPSPNAEGRYFILPEKLHRVEDFIEKWQSSWAMALLPYHPEYGYYVWTDSNKVSYEYDAQLLSTHLYSEASSGGMTNHLAAGLGFDPYFIAHPAAAALMMDSLRLADSINYRTTPGGPLIRRFFSIEDLTYISARCNNPVFNGAQMVACLGGNRPFGSATTADAEWNIYRGIYLSKKMAVLDRERRAWVAAVGAYNNDYIGTVSGGPYRNKIKRFPSPSDTTQFRDEHGAAFDGPFALRRYQEQRLKITCGICPIAKDLETVLFALAYQGRLVSPIRFPEGPLLSLPLSLIQQFSVPADLQYEWRPTVASGTVLQIEIWATNAKRNVCTLRLTKDTDAVAWKDIRFFNCMQAQSDTEFTLNAYDAEMTKVEVRGFVSCFKLKTCPSVTQSPVCLKLPLADDFAAFLNYMFQPASPRRYPQKSLLVHRKGAPSTYFSKALEKYHPAGTEWVWNYRSGDLKTRFVADYLIRANQQTLVSCSLDFSIVGTGFVFDDIRRIIQISKGSESSPNVFFLTALTATGRTFLIRVQQSGCFQFFNCAPLNDNTPESPLLCCIPMAPPVQVSQPSCMERLGQIAASHATRRFETYVEQLRDSIGNAYTERCLAAAEQARLQYTDAIYQYTLFYYDRAGNLTKTIPPKGVVLLSAAQMTQTANFRNKTGSTPVYPAHRMASTYLYNSLNAAIQRITPDDGRTRTCYDQVGRVILSQDAQQFKDRACTYLTYDPHGRVLETGRLATLPVGALIPARLSYKEAFLPNWYNAYTRSEIYRTQYDYPLSDKVYAYFEAGQKHLRNRIASVTFQQVSSGTYDHAMHYGYDVLGNIREFVQESVRLFKEYKSVPAVAAQAVKTIRYQYDQHSGIVTQSIYQPGKADQFVHWYEYDADNRVQTVLTSTNLYDDPVLRDREAKYAYYDHGPLARIEIGSERVQGIDYAYTLQGWLKGINSVLDDPARDMGSDGGGSSPFAADAYGFALGYRQGDYKPIGARHFLPRYEAPAVNAVEQDSRDLWDGNIQYTLSRIAGLSRPVTANVYSYDQAQRIRSSRFYAMQATPAGRYNTDGLPWQSQTAYATDYEYDPNGNITRLRRRGESSNLFDNLSYNYANVQQNNRLSNITDSGVRLPDNSDLANQVNNNYAYDDKGRLLWDLGENSNLRWSNTDKLTTYTRSGKTTRFYYDALGRRAAKIISDKEQVLYIRDALGNVLAEYRIDKNRVFWQNSPIYAPGRIGMYQPEKELPADAPDSRRSGDRRGLRLYELGSHTGDVLAVVSDRRLPAPPAGGTAAAVADLRHAEDYYPFGMPMPGRAMAGAGYRYGFQGMERDDDLKGRGNSYTTEFRQYDARVGRWLSVDPEGTRFPEVSPYVAHLNNSNQFIDRDGDVPINVLVDNVTASRIKNWYLEVQEYGPNGQLGEKQIIPGRVINNHMVQFEAHSIPRNGIYRVSSIYFLTPIKINGLDSRLPIIGSGQITSGSLTISSNRLEASGNLLILDIATKDAVNLQLELEGSGEPGGIGIAGTGAAGITVGRVPTGEGELKLGDPRQPESEAHSQNRETNFQSREHGAIGRSNEQAATRTARARSAVRGERVTVPERARRPARDRSSRNRRQTPTINITCQNNCTINVDSDRNTTTNSTNDERK
jgi:RHS repeat-associated protein